MSKLRFTISMSLDGFVAGPAQSLDDPLGIGGMGLHEWVFPLAAWRAPHGMEGGIVNESTPVVAERLENIGATIMGRKMFGGGPGPWPTDDPWNGWWGDDPPFHHPVFVLTHHAREPLVCEGGTTFTFVGDGIGSALAQARAAAAGKDVSLAGGAETARQYLAADLVDEMEISLVPILLGDGRAPLRGPRNGRAQAHSHPDGRRAGRDAPTVRTSLRAWPATSRPVVVAGPGTNPPPAPHRPTVAVGRSPVRAPWTAARRAPPPAPRVRPRPGRRPRASRRSPRRSCVPSSG